MKNIKLTFSSEKKSAAVYQ